MSEESTDTTDESSDASDAEELREDPAELDKDERYDDRYQEARESANPDDHRDEEPHS